MALAETPVARAAAGYPAQAHMKRRTKRWGRILFNTLLTARLLLPASFFWGLCVGCLSGSSQRLNTLEIVTVDTVVGKKELYVPAGLKTDTNRPKTAPGGLYWDGQLKPGDYIETRDARRFSFERVQEAMMRSPENAKFLIDDAGQIVEGFIR